MALKTLREQAHTATVPVQAFKIMAPLAAKDEHMAAERIGADDLLHLGRQTVKPGSQIDRLAGEKNLGSRRHTNHPSPRTTDSTRRSAFSLTLLSTRTRTPPGRSISMTPTRSAKARPVPREHTAPVVIGIIGPWPDASSTTPT